MSLERSQAQRLIARAEKELEGASAHDTIKWVDAALEGRLVVATSLQDAVLIDIAVKVRADIDIVFLDTGYHFAETIGMRDAVRTTYGARLITVSPSQTVEEQDADHGPELFKRDPDLCCFMRKVQPLNAMLSLYDGWVTGLRRSEAASRANARAFEWDEAREVLKVNPIVDWTDEEVDTYIAEHNVLVNPLISEGYPSVGCAPCTRRVSDGEDARSGRWAGSNKIECGIHQ